MVNLLKSFDHPPENFDHPPENFGQPPGKFGQAQAGTTWGLSFIALHRLCQPGQAHQDFVQPPESFVKPPEDSWKVSSSIDTLITKICTIHSCHQSEAILKTRLLITSRTAASGVVAASSRMP